MLLTSIHDQIPSDFGLPVIPRCFKTLSEANAEVLEVTFAHQGLRGAGGDQRAFDGQDQCWASVKIDAVVGLTERCGRRSHDTRVKGKDMEEKNLTYFCLFGGSSSSVLEHTILHYTPSFTTRAVIEWAQQPVRHYLIAVSACDWHIGY